jgi:signal transduction histidine kinase
LTDDTRMRLVRAAWAVTIALALTNAALIVIARRELATSGGDIIFASVGTVAAILYASTGLLIADRARSVIGWIFVVAGTSLALQILSSTYPAVGLLARPDSLPAPKLVSALLQPMWIGNLLSLALVLLLFPEGTPPSRGWRPLLFVVITGGVLGYVGSALNPVPLAPNTGMRFANPLGIERFGGAISTILVGLAWVDVLAAVGCAVALVHRFRHGGPELRQQIKWLGFAAAGAGVCLVVSLISLVACSCDNTVVGSISFTIFFLILALGVPAAIAIALFKYRLYDLDLIVNKAVLYVMLAAVFTIVYLAIVIGIGTLVGNRGNGLLTTIAAVVIAIAFNPIRERLRGFANRVVYGKRATPYEVLSEFSENVAGTYSSDDVLPRMAEILATGTGAAEARVWLRLENELRPAASWPSDAAPASVVPANGEVAKFPTGEHAAEVRHQGELLGALSVVMSASEPMNPSKEALVRDLAAQAGLVLRNVRLVEDLRASRRRIVSAQDERAKALERNIHDGAQQQLVALSVKQRLVQTLIDRDPEKARSMMEDLQADTVDALETLRDLARGIYPPLLADKGLAAALEAQGRKSVVPVTVEAEGIERYPQDVEAAVYFCCLEALQNVTKYAQAEGAIVRLSASDGTLTFEVTDGGAGFDPRTTGYGTGLQGMADRLEAIGGHLEVHSEPGVGTTVGGTVRVASS